MIFNFVVTIILLSSTLARGYLLWENSQKNPTSAEESIVTAEVETPKSTWKSKIEDPLNKIEFFDLDKDHKTEKITIYSTLGQEIGDEHTRIYLNDSQEPALTLIGYFDTFQVHTIGINNQKVIQIGTISGHSIETNFYAYKKGKLTIIPVSTAKPPSFYGIVSRNEPEFEDIDNDGKLELLAYYNFLYDPTRTVEVYEYDDLAFNLVQKYEEETPVEYFN